MKKPQSIMSVVNSAKEAKNHFSSLQSDLRSRISWLKTQRENESQEPLKADFSKVLTEWGIDSPDNIPDAIHYLKIRLALFAALPSLYGFICLFNPTFIHFLVLLILALPCLFGILATCWRIWVLKNHSFMSFTDWLMHGFGG